MFERLRKARESEGGFTLIELLIVIVILGVLAGIVVFSVTGITDRGNVSACKSDVKEVAVAAEASFAQNGAYPAALADMSPGFLRSVPADVTYTFNGATVAPGIVGKAGSPCDGFVS